MAKKGKKSLSDCIIEEIIDQITGKLNKKVFEKNLHKIVTDRIKEWIK